MAAAVFSFSIAGKHVLLEEADGIIAVHSATRPLCLTHAVLVSNEYANGWALYDVRCMSTTLAVTTLVRMISETEMGAFATVVYRHAADGVLFVPSGEIAFEVRPEASVSVVAISDVCQGLKTVGINPPSIAVVRLVSPLTGESAVVVADRIKRHPDVLRVEPSSVVMTPSAAAAVSPMPIARSSSRSSFVFGAPSPPRSNSSSGGSSRNLMDTSGPLYFRLASPPTRHTISFRWPEIVMQEERNVIAVVAPYTPIMLRAAAPLLSPAAERCLRVYDVSSLVAATGHTCEDFITRLTLQGLYVTRVYTRVGFPLGGEFIPTGELSIEADSAARLAEVATTARLSDVQTVDMPDGRHVCVARAGAFALADGETAFDLAARLQRVTGVLAAEPVMFGGAVLPTPDGMK